MLYPVMTMANGTDMVYSDIFHKPNDPTDYIQVFYERVNADGDDFDSMSCILPGGKMQDVVGFSSAEVKKEESRLRKVKKILIDTAKNNEQN